jgi:hypothetical protein
MFPFASGSAKSNLMCPVNSYSLIGYLFNGAFFKLKLEKSTYTALFDSLPFSAFYTSPKLNPILNPLVSDATLAPISKSLLSLTMSA